MKSELCYTSRLQQYKYVIDENCSHYHGICRVSISMCHTLSIVSWPICSLNRPFYMSRCCVDVMSHYHVTGEIFSDYYEHQAGQIL